MSNNPPPATLVDSQNKNQIVSILSILGCILLFLFILFVAYLPDSGQDPLARSAAERTAILNEVESEAAREMTSLEVVDPQAGIYKIPVDQAMELTIQQYKQKEK